MERVDQARSEWRIDALSAAAMLLAGNIPRYCAQSQGDPAGRAPCFSSYLIYGAMQLRDGDWSAIRAVVDKAVNEGYVESLDQLGTALLDEAHGHRDLALNGPPDRMEFARELATAAPFALAAQLLSRWTRESLGPVADPLQVRLHRETSAEELWVRLNDGLMSQWFDWLMGRTSQERAEIAAAKAAGDELLVAQLLAEGEDGYRRPRSARAFLLPGA